MMKGNQYPAKFRVMENFHIVLWLFKDMCWCMGWKIVGMFMIGPTFGFAVYITWLGRTSRTERFHNSAIIFWIMANSVWMTGDFAGVQAHRNVALLFFVCGIVIVGYYYTMKIVFKLKIFKKNISR